MNKSFGLFAVLPFVLSAALCAQPMTLTTTFAAGNGQSGNMFDLDVVAPVILDSFDVHLGAGLSATVEVYVVTGGGSYATVNANAAAWTLIGTATVTSAGTGVPTPLNLTLNQPLVPGLTQGIYVTTTASTLQYTNGGTVGAVYASDPIMTFYEGIGVAYPFGGVFSPRIFNGNIHYTVIGGTPSYQVNQPGASLDINSVATTGFAAAATSQVYCTNNALHWTAGPGAATFDIAVTLNDTLVPNALTTAGNQIVNVNLVAPVFLWAFGGSFATPFFPVSLPFAFSSGAPTLQAQMVVIDASSIDGVFLSQGVDHTTLPGSGGAAITLPAVDDGGQAISFAGTCWFADGTAEFFGTPYTDIVVCSNGRVLAGSVVDTDFSPTVLEAIGDAPMIGNWTDLNPSAGGVYSISSPFPDAININYSGVPFFGQTPTVSYDIDYNDAVGEWTLANLQGIMPRTAAADQLLGMSPGNGVAVDPGSVTFFAGGVAAFGSPSGPNDMLYEFSTGILQHTSIAMGLSGIVFSPDGLGNYTWLSY